jgi:electron transfer flavoprotein beta subunit
VIVAELLGLPHGTIIMQVEKTDGGIRVKRELEDGWFQWISLPLPAVLTIQSGINKLRYATLMGIKKAKLKEVRRLTAAELGVAPTEEAKLTQVYMPQRSKQTVLIEGDARQQAARLAAILKQEVRVL